MVRCGFFLIRVPISVGWFPVHGCYKDIVGSLGNKGVQEGYGPIGFLGFSVVNCIWGVYGVDVLEELVPMFCLLDDKDAKHVPKPKPGWIGVRADGFGFKIFHEQVCNYEDNKGAPFLPT